MKFNHFFKPKQFMGSLPEKLSWELLFILIVTGVINFIIIIFVIDFEVLRKTMTIMGGYSLDTHIPNETIIESLILLALIALPMKIFKVGIIAFIFKFTLKLFKKNIGYLKLINIYMYSKIAKNLIVFFGTIAITGQGKNALIAIATSKTNIMLHLKVLYSYENIVAIALSIFSILVFYGLLVYGTKLSVKNKIAPIK